MAKVIIIYNPGMSDMRDIDKAREILLKSAKNVFNEEAILELHPNEFADDNMEIKISLDSQLEKEVAEEKKRLIIRELNKFSIDGFIFLSFSPELVLRL